MSMSQESISFRQTAVDMFGADVVVRGSAADAIDGIEPEVVISPRNTGELSEFLSFANRERLAVAPRGGGTQLELGNRLERLDAVVDITGLNRVVQHNAADLTLAVEAGITLSMLRKTLAAEGQFLALDAPLPERATIGGTLAAGVSGPLKWQYGSARDMVIGMKVAQADGRITQSGGNVVKNVSGYDMARLHVGGLGTLGVITEVSFKLTPIPHSESNVLGLFRSAKDCFDAAMGIFNSGVMPSAMTAFDTGSARRIEYQGLGSDCYMLLVRLGGRPRTLQRMERETRAMFRAHGAVEGTDSYWTNDLSLSLADFGHAQRSKSVMSARISVLPNTMYKITEAISDEDVAIVAQPGYGMMHAHWFGGNAGISEVIRHARDVVRGVGGSMIVERAPLSVKSGLDVWDYQGESLEVMRRLKAQYDPNRILNPSRFIGGI